MTKEQEEALKLIEDSMNKKCNGLECKVVKNNIDLRLENIKLNKQIDLMTEYIDGDDTSLSNYLYRKNGKCNKKMIKQYFKKLAEQNSSIN